MNTCFFCNSPVTDDDYCEGCRHFVCLQCDQSVDLELFVNHRHRVHEHRHEERA